MKIARTVLLLTGSLSSFAFAGEMPAGAPGKLNDPNLWLRCGKEGQQIPQDQCRQQTESAKATGCITDEEYNFAVANGAAVMCIGIWLQSACPCGCFEADTRILSYDVNSLPTWINAAEVHRDTPLVAVSKDATLKNLSLTESKASYSTNGPEIPALYVFKTAESKLSVTQNHAMLLSDGRLVAAKNVKKSDKLIAMDGSPVAILSIERKTTSKPVYNFGVAKAHSDKEHLVVAEGLVVGDIYLQNSLSSIKNSILQRK
jgi:hypothetical protein